MIQGIRVENGAFAGGAFDWATPFALLCGLGVVSGYALLGATWLVMKTTGPVADRARGQAKMLLLAVLGFMGAVSLWTPLTQPAIAQRWFSLPNILYLWPVPVVTALIAFGAWRALESVGKNLPENSTLRGMIINSRDVTDRKGAEEALQESEVRYRSLVESTHDLVQSVSPDGHFLLVNSAWLNTLGFTAEEVPLLTLFEIVHPDFQLHCQSLFAKVRAGQEFSHVRIAFVAKDGRTIPVEGTVSGRYQNGRLVAAHGPDPIARSDARDEGGDHVARRASEGAGDLG